MAVRARLPGAIALVLGVSMLHAQARPSEYQVKAAYLLNFGQFAQWKSLEGLNDTYQNLRARP